MNALIGATTTAHLEKQLALFASSTLQVIE
jgi:hypothetical protein